MWKLGLALMAGAFATAAGAVTFTSIGGAPDPGPAPGERIRYDFDDIQLGYFAITNGPIAVQMGSNAQASAPAGNDTSYGFIPAPGPGFGRIAFHGTTSVSFYWGSIEADNSIDVIGRINSVNDMVLLTITGAQLLGVASEQGEAATNRRVFLTAAAGERITSLGFRSPQAPFEFDAFATAAVPEPATWAILVAGFGLVGSLQRRRRKVSPAVA